MKPDFQIRVLARNDKRTDFRTGDIDLDRFFQRYAGQNQFRYHIGTTYIGVNSERIAGFVTVSPCELTADVIRRATKKRLPAYPIPVLRVSRLGVDTRAQGQGIGSALLRFAFGLALQLRERFGCAGIVVDAKPGAVDFYRRLGFVEFETVAGSLGERPEPQPLFLPIQKVEKATDPPRHDSPQA